MLICRSLVFSCLLISLVWAEITIQVRDSAFTTDVPLLFREPQPSLQASSVAALHGAEGIQIRSIPGRGTYCNAYVDIQKKRIWNRFYFYIDTVYFDKLNPEGRQDQRTRIVAYGFTRTLKKDQPEYLAGLYVKRASERDAPEMLFSLTPLSASAIENHFSLPVNTKQLYCVEMFISFETADSVDVQFYLNGSPVWRHRTVYHYGQECAQVVAGTYSYISSARWRIFLDDFAVSDRRIPPIPAKPVDCAEDPAYNNAILSCSLPDSCYSGEKIIASNWKVYFSSDTLFPVFESIDSIAPLDSESIPFALDSGQYEWRVRFKNNFGVWGNWSDRRAFKISENRALSIHLDDFFIALPNQNKSIALLRPGEWYEFHAKISRTIKWEDVGYLLIYLRNPSYTLGHPGNRGGLFLKEANCIYNIWFNQPRGISEKRVTDSAVSPQQWKGEAVILDTVSGRIRFRGQLPEEAKEGVWQAVAYLRDTRDNLSNVRYAALRLAKESNSSRDLIFLFSGIVLLLILFVVGYVLKSRKPPVVLATAESDAVLSYVRANLREKLTSDHVMKALDLSQKDFRNAVSVSSKNFPTLVIRLRIEKAKELLAGADNSVSEVSTLVGIGDPLYFYKIFKKHTGKSPSEFRKEARLEKLRTSSDQ